MRALDRTDLDRQLPAGLEHVEADEAGLIRRADRDLEPADRRLGADRDASPGDRV
jgi:hypothetical protein